MQQILAAFDGFVLGLALLLLAAVGAGGASALVRGRSTEPHGLREPLVDAGLAYSALSVGYLVFTPQLPPPERVSPELGSDVEVALAAGPGDAEPWIQLGGNLVLLLPLGMLVPKRVGWFDNLGKIALGGLAVSACIELVQFLAISGRVASTDDIACNTAGAALGGLLAKLPGWLSPAARAQHRSTGENDRTVWLLIEKIEQERRTRRPARSSPHRRPAPIPREVIGHQVALQRHRTEPLRRPSSLA
ncbi:VanZ family protein [Saccharopolyspora griseoalba]|uniref:VanZ family protein n=1 Tax=Saccharopolyspora griseoalba TaxID=1431848 RepID=A0ABW2LKI1_9PSEU